MPHMKTELGERWHGWDLKVSEKVTRKKSGNFAKSAGEKPFKAPQQDALADEPTDSTEAVDFALTQTHKEEKKHCVISVPLSYEALFEWHFSHFFVLRLLDVHNKSDI